MVNSKSYHTDKLVNSKSYHKDGLEKQTMGFKICVLFLINTTQSKLLTNPAMIFK